MSALSARKAGRKSGFQAWTGHGPQQPAQIELTHGLSRRFLAQRIILNQYCGRNAKTRGQAANHLKG